jgi:hypothetical protein
MRCYLQYNLDKNLILMLFLYVYKHLAKVWNHLRSDLYKMDICRILQATVTTEHGSCWRMQETMLNSVN